MSKLNQLWKCPRCGHKFVTKNIWHSCGNYDFDRHFENKEPIVRELFNKYRLMVESCGGVTCYPQKSRIVFMVRMRFAGCNTSRDSLRCALLLPRRYEHAKCLEKIEQYGGNSYGHYFRIQRFQDLDSGFMRLIRKAYEVGQQKSTLPKRKTSQTL